MAIFEIRDDRFGGESMAHRVAARTSFALSRSSVSLWSFAFGRHFGLWDCRQILTFLGVRLLPKLPRETKAVDLEVFPPGDFIAGLMERAVMAPAQRYGELVADFDS